MREKSTTSQQWSKVNTIFDYIQSLKKKKSVVLKDTHKGNISYKLFSDKANQVSMGFKSPLLGWKNFFPISKTRKVQLKKGSHSYTLVQNNISTVEEWIRIIITNQVHFILGMKGSWKYNHQLI